MEPLNIVDINLSFVSEFECAFPVFLAKGICLIDFGIFRELSVRFHWKKDQFNW